MRYLILDHFLDFDLPILKDFIEATPTAELEPITKDYVQSDEIDMGMTVSVFLTTPSQALYVSMLCSSALSVFLGSPDQELIIVCSMTSSANLASYERSRNSARFRCLRSWLGSGRSREVWNRRRLPPRSR